MDRNDTILNEPKELVVRGSYKRPIFLAILLSIPCIGLLTESLENWKKLINETNFLMILLVLFIYGMSIYYWFKVFDKRIKLIINSKGIWSLKTGFIDWSNFWYFYVKEEKTTKAGTFRFIILKKKNDEKDYKIDLTFYDKTYEEVKEAININSKKYPVIDLRFETNA